jgi:hypothetical protein
MAKPKKWSINDLENAVLTSTSKRQVLKKLGLVEAGGNYSQIEKYITLYEIDSSHFLGQAANRGRNLNRKPVYELSSILVRNSTFQSFKLKKRLFKEKIKKEICELCGWAKVSVDGRIPLELDHINGVHSDNRIENLRILCPNCHSLQITHRGKNKRKG